MTDDVLNPPINTGGPCGICGVPEGARCTVGCWAMQIETKKLRAVLDEVAAALPNVTQLRDELVDLRRRTGVAEQTLRTLVATITGGNGNDLTAAVDKLERMRITEEERQMMLLALAKLSNERPGWDDMLNRFACKHDNVTEAGRAKMYDEFRELRFETKELHEERVE